MHDLRDVESASGDVCRYENANRIVAEGADNAIAPPLREIAMDRIGVVAIGAQLSR